MNYNAINKKSEYTSTYLSPYHRIQFNWFHYHHLSKSGLIVFYSKWSSNVGKLFIKRRNKRRSAFVVDWKWKRKTLDFFLHRSYTSITKAMLLSPQGSKTFFLPADGRFLPARISRDKAVKPKTCTTFLWTISVHVFDPCFSTCKIVETNSSGPYMS